jgi:hypothetical protein
MKLLLLAALLAATCVAPSHASDDWRTVGAGLYGAPKGDVLDSELMARGRLDKALKDGTAGYTAPVYQYYDYKQVTSAGCINNNTTTVTIEGSDGPIKVPVTTTSSCENNGNQSGSVNQTNSGSISNKNK